MNKKMIEKYTYRIECSEENQGHVARCLEFLSLAAQGNTVKDACKRSSTSSRND